MRADGRELPVELAVTAALDRGVKVYTVYLRDISERKRAEREQAAEHATLRILSESASLGEAAAPLLETLCTAHGWDLGTIWMRDDNVGAVRCLSLWRAPGVQVPELEALEGDVFFPVGAGLVGRVSTHRGDDVGRGPQEGRGLPAHAPGRAPRPRLHGRHPRAGRAASAWASSSSTRARLAPTTPTCARASPPSAASSASSRTAAGPRRPCGRARSASAPCSRTAPT